MTVIAPVKQAVPVEAPSGPAKDAGAAAASSPKAVPQQDPHSFVSPVMRVDARTGLTLTILRDTTNGSELSQYPSKQVLASYGQSSKPASKDDGTA